MRELRGTRYYFISGQGRGWAGIWSNILTNYVWPCKKQSNDPSQAGLDRYNRPCSAQSPDSLGLVPTTEIDPRTSRGTRTRNHDDGWSMLFIVYVLFYDRIHLDGSYDEIWVSLLSVIDRIFCQHLLASAGWSITLGITRRNESNCEAGLSPRSPHSFLHMERYMEQVTLFMIQSS